MSRLPKVFVRYERDAVTKRMVRASTESNLPPLDKVSELKTRIKELESELENTSTQSQCERVKQLELALHKLEVGSCKCLTKTNEHQYHAEFCPTRIIGDALNQLPPKVGE